MSVKGKLFGHDIEIIDNMWLFSDTLEPTKSTYKSRACGECGEYMDESDHDPCIKNLPDVLNACCGHGDIEQCYMMLEDRRCYYGEEALVIINSLKQKGGLC